MPMTKIKSNTKLINSKKTVKINRFSAKIRRPGPLQVDKTNILARTVVEYIILDKVATNILARTGVEFIIHSLSKKKTSVSRFSITST